MTLKEARKRKGFTQKDLAEMIGIAPTSLSFIENYKAFPRGATRNRLQKIFGNQLELYPTSLLEGMLSRCIAADPMRAEFLKSQIDECIDKNLKPIKS